MDAIYGFDAKRFFLGTLCKHNHQWGSAKQSLRYCSDRTCVVCAKLKSARQSAAGYQARWNAKHRSIHGRPSRSKNASGEVLPVGIGRGSAGVALLARGLTIDDLALAVHEHKALWAAIRQVGKCPSVARLVMREQRRYWNENPDAKQMHERQWGKASWWLQYQINPRLRLYTRQKSKRRKAMERGSIGIQVKGSQVAKRFAEFGDCCAYCGDKDGLHIEHVIPISKGGTHVLSNVVPACRACNFSKRDKDAEAWYRAQPFFCEKRWRKILRVMGVRKGPATQLALL